MTIIRASIRQRNVPIGAAALALAAGLAACAADADEHEGAQAHELPAAAQISSSALDAPADVTLQPATIAPEQSFVVRWTPSTSTPTLGYRVELRAPADAGAALLWTSPEITGRLMTYNGPPLRPAGAYRVEVVARVGDAEVRSEPLTLQVVDPVQSAVPSAVSSAVPTWARALPGSYAVRTETFAQSPLGPMLTDRQLALAEFVEVQGGRLELRTRLCSKRASSLGLTVYLAKPESLPETTQRVVLANGGWSTEPATFSFGYERQGYPACSGRRGERVNKRPEQTWIRSSTCLCNANSEEPTFDDCRVTDPDRDGSPGIAYKYSGTPDVESWVAHSGVVSRTRYVSGTVDPNGNHYGSLKTDETTFFLACEPGGCNLPNTARPCTSDFNGSQFHRLPAPPPGQATWTCEALLGQQAALFATPSAPTPSRCTRDSVTETP